MAIACTQTGVLPEDSLRIIADAGPKANLTGKYRTVSTMPYTSSSSSSTDSADTIETPDIPDGEQTLRSIEMNTQPSTSIARAWAQVQQLDLVLGEDIRSLSRRVGTNLRPRRSNILR